MRKPLIILGSTGVQMLDEMSPRPGIKPVEVLIRKGTQQQFCLIKSARMRRRIERSEARMAGKIGARIMSCQR
jgi:hypothetical protein